MSPPSPTLSLPWTASTPCYAVQTWRLFLHPSSMHSHLCVWYSTSIIPRQTCQMSTRLQWVGPLVDLIALCNSNGLLVLHPPLKLKYFWQHEWTQEWIDAAKGILWDEYLKYDAPNKVNTDLVSRLCFFSLFLKLTTVIGWVHDQWQCHRLLQHSNGNIQGLDKLDKYLLQPMKKVHDPVKWWWDCCHQFLNLLKMALDYLSISGTSPYSYHVLFFDMNHQQHLLLLNTYFLKAGSFSTSCTIGYLEHRSVQCCAFETGTRRTWLILLTFLKLLRMVRVSVSMSWVKYQVTMTEQLSWHIITFCSSYVLFPQAPPVVSSCSCMVYHGVFMKTLEYK